jgi:deoxycytidine triphosphate deaminase
LEYHTLGSSQLAEESAGQLRSSAPLALSSEVKASIDGRLIRAGKAVRNRSTIRMRWLTDLEKLAATGAASLDLRLGRWFRTLRHSRTDHLSMIIPDDVAEIRDDAVPTKEYFVPSGDRFILHPHNFVLRITLEWMRLPSFWMPENTFDLGRFELV